MEQDKDAVDPGGRRSLAHLVRAYPVGERFSNSEVYDEATAEVVHGFQVFAQKREDGSPTGRRSFVNAQGVLCGLEMAESERARELADAAPDLLSAAALVLRGYGVTFQDAAVRELLSEAVARAAGVRL